MKIFETGMGTLHFLITFNVIVLLILAAYVIAAIKHQNVQSSIIFVVLFVFYLFMVIAFLNWNHVEGISDMITSTGDHPF